jgi:hypothetical protein
MLRSTDLRAASEELHTVVKLLGVRADTYASTAEVVTRSQEAFASGIESPLKPDLMRTMNDARDAALSIERQLHHAREALDRLAATASRLAGEAATYESQAAAAESTAHRRSTVFDFGLPTTAPTDGAARSAEAAEAERAAAAAQAGLQRVADQWRGACVAASQVLEQSAQTLETSPVAWLVDVVTAVLDHPIWRAIEIATDSILIERVDTWRRSPNTEVPTRGNSSLAQKLARLVGGSRAEQFLMQPAVQATVRRFSAVASGYDAVTGVVDLIRQGNMGRAFEERGAHYVEDITGTAFSASQALFFALPNKFTGAALVVTGVAHVGVMAYNRREEIADGFRRGIRWVGSVLDRSDADEFLPGQDLAREPVGQVCDFVPSTVGVSNR